VRGEAEPPAWLRWAGLDFDFDVDEAGPLQALGQGGWIHRHAGIAGVHLAPFGSVDAVDANEQSAGTQHPADLGEQAILLCRRRHVVQHGERSGARKALIFKREGRAVGVDNVNVGAMQPLSELRGQVWIDFDGGQSGNGLSKQVSRQARAGPDFEHVLAKVSLAHSPGQDLRFDGLGPFGTGTYLEVALIHR